MMTYYKFLVIGDEILKGQVKDTNSYYMCNLLYKCGIKMKKVSGEKFNLLQQLYITRYIL